MFDINFMLLYAYEKVVFISNESNVPKKEIAAGVKLKKFKFNYENFTTSICIRKWETGFFFSSEAFRSGTKNNLSVSDASQHVRDFDGFNPNVDDDDEAK